jgi:hypothetical protein
LQEDIGNVGIGTTSPASKLEVNGGVGVATTGGTLIVRQDGDTGGDGIALTSSFATSHRIWKNAAGDLNIGNSGNLSALVQLMNGNLGIGTISPGVPLEISNAGTELRLRYSATTYTDFRTDFINQISAGANSWQFQFNSNPLLTIQSTGNVGIGVTSPTHKLHVYSAVPTGGIGLKVESGNVTNWIQNKSTGSSWQIGSTGSGFQLYNDDTSSYRFIVENGGNVGIGTTSPEEKLHIVNAANASVDNFMLELQNTTTVADSRSGILFSTNSGTGSSRAGCAIQGSNNRH